MKEQNEAILSPALLAAQQKLLELRRERRSRRVNLGLPLYTDIHGRSLHPQKENTSTPQQLPDWPAHLGWHSQPLTAAVRAAHKQQPGRQEGEAADMLAWLPGQVIAPAPQATATGLPRAPHQVMLKLYPDIALGMLKQNLASPGRIWLLLQQLDPAGSGWIALSTARELLTKRDSAWRVCGWRQLRNLLAQGEAIFWQQGSDRVWLRSVTKVALALKVKRLTGQPVAMPASLLLKGMGAVRAHFYASFHSGRCSQGANSQTPRAKPIARTTLERISHVSRRSQHNYEKRAGIRRQRNYVIGEVATQAREQARAWRQGQALFRFTDRKGRHGKAGITYLAWQLPNHYIGPHATRPKGRQKRINRELTDLFMKGMTGNGKNLVDGRYHGCKRFYNCGSTAARAYNRLGSADLYWHGRQARTSDQHFWHLLPGQESAG